MADLDKGHWSDRTDFRNNLGSKHIEAFHFELQKVRKFGKKSRFLSYTKDNRDHNSKKHRVRTLPIHTPWPQSWVQSTVPPPFDLHPSGPIPLPE